MSKGTGMFSIYAGAQGRNARPASLKMQRIRVSIIDVQRENMTMMLVSQDGNGSHACAVRTVFC